MAAVTKVKVTMNTDQTITMEMVMIMVTTMANMGSIMVTTMENMGSIMTTSTVTT